MNNNLYDPYHYPAAAEVTSSEQQHSVCPSRKGNYS